jgi:hypothetical protein
MSNATYYPTSGATGGAVTPNPSEASSRYPYSGGTTRPTTDAKGLLRERGNIRWQKVLEALNKYTQADIMNVDITEANGDAQATAISFTVRYERDAFNTEEDLDSAGTMLTGANCIKQMVAVAISNTHTMMRRVYQPEDTTNEDQMVSVTAQATNTRANIEGTITVETSATAGSGIEETAQS